MNLENSEQKPLLVFHCMAYVDAELVQGALYKQKSLQTWAQFCAKLNQAQSNPSSPLYSGT